MKYKVGDKFRMVDGGIASVEGARCDIYKVIDDGGVNYVTNAYISHQIISEITDELIDRFKKEKIAWHFKSEEDYEKALDILYRKRIHYGLSRYGFDYNCINYRKDEDSLYRQNIEHYQKEGYEIIEIMNPVYVPKKLVIDEVNGDIKVHGYSLKIINDIFYADGLRLEYQDGKLCYKGIECEVLFQGYQTMQFFEKKFKEQQDDINTLHYRLDCAKYERERYLKENNDLKQMIKNQQFVIQSHREKLGTIRDVLDED